MPAELQLPCLCLVADCSVVPLNELPQRVSEAVNGGVTLVQLRGKELPGGTLLSLAKAVGEACQGVAPLLINERVDVSIAAGAHGVQLGEDALPVPVARRILQPGAVIGRSVHSVDGAICAQEVGADLLLLGTMFATQSHPGGHAAGPELMARVAARCHLPLVGIGGISPENAGQVMAAGAAGVAVIRDILAAPDPGASAGKLMDALLESWRNRCPAGDNVSGSAGTAPPFQRPVAL